MKSLKETIDESLLSVMTLGPILALLVGVGTFGTFSELKGPYDIVEIIREWWKNSKTSEIVHNLMNDSEIESLKSKPKYVQNKLLYSMMDSKLSQKELDILANATGNKIKAEI